MQMTSVKFRNIDVAALHGFAVLFLFMLSACSTPPPQKTPDASEIRRKEIEAATTLAQDIDPLIKIRDNREIGVYLRNFAENISRFMNPPLNAPIGVLPVEPIGNVWKSFALPPARIYLSVGILKSVENDAELAAAIALQLAHLQLGHALAGKSFLAQAAPTEPAPRFHPRNLNDLFGPAGIFTFSGADNTRAAEEAAQILYRSGYDPRGLSALFTRFHEHPEHSPWDPDTLEKMLKSTRRVIAQNAPLRNPVVRTPEFPAIQKRMRRL